MNKFLLRGTAFIIILFIGLHLTSELALQYRLSKWIKFWPQMTWTDYNTQPPGSIDMLLLGSSRCFRTFVPQVFDSILNCNSFNFGTGGQKPRTTYYVLKEILRKHSPKYIVLELSFRSFASDRKSKDAYVIFDFISSRRIRSELLGSTFQYSDYPELIFPILRRNYYKLFKPGFKTNLKKGKFEKYLDYAGKGFVETITPDSLKAEVIYKYPILQPEEFHKKQVDYLIKLINLCQDNEIQLFVVTQPYHPEYLGYCDDYNIISNGLNEILTQASVIYKDYNLPINNLSDMDWDFLDYAHLRNKSPKEFSILVANDFTKLFIKDDL